MQRKKLDKPKNLLDLLKNQENKLNHATFILRKKIYRRKVFIYFVMGSVMAGTAFFIYHKLTKYMEFKSSLDSNSADLFDSLSSQLNEACTNSTQFQNIFYQLKNEVSKLNDSLFTVTNNLRNTKITLWCVSPDGDGHYEEKSCWDRLYHKDAQCWDQGFADCIITWRGSFDCRKIINNFCKIPTALADKTLQMNVAEEAMNISMDIMKNITSQIANTFPGYESLYLGLSGVLYSCLYAFMLGEVSPAAIILLTLLTNVITDCVCCVARLDQDEEPEIIETFSESKIKDQDLIYDIPPNPTLLNYALGLRALEKAEQHNNKYFELDEEANKYRMLVYRYIPVIGIVKIISDMADLIDLSKELADKDIFDNSMINGEEKMSDGTICLNKILPFWERGQLGNKRITVVDNNQAENFAANRSP